ncbi:hypothetical protein ACIOWI_32375 [Streptomyces sp. NPDC087659]|uniref:hypothetical protein n=1 Tax=Streptomyces sp. NPDC087659 TaxID=3365801 RepID=UPI0037F75CB4
MPGSVSQSRTGRRERISRLSVLSTTHLRCSTHAAGGATPEQALAQANRRLVDLNPGRFAGCLDAHLDLARRQAVRAPAGHPR